MSIGKFQPCRQYDLSLSGFEQTQEERTLLEESQGQCPGVRSKGHTQIEPGQYIGEQVPPLEFRQGINRSLRRFRSLIRKLFQQHQHAVHGIGPARRLGDGGHHCQGRIGPQLVGQQVKKLLGRTPRRHG